MLNQVLRYPSNPHYNTPFWMAITTHEMSHVWQSGRCWAYLPYVEFAASLKGYDVLADMCEDGVEGSCAGLVYGLRRDAIYAASDLICKDGKDPKKELYPKLKLSETEKYYLNKVTCAELKVRASMYWTNFWTTLLNNDTGIFDYPEYSGMRQKVDASNLLQFINELP
jgi:hypothetical protein